MFCGDLNGKEIQKKGDIFKHIADSLCCTEETNTTLYSNCTPIKKEMLPQFSLFHGFSLLLHNDSIY